MPYSDNEHKTVKCQDRATHSFSNRSLLDNASVDDIQDIFEKDMVIKYQDTLRRLHQKQQELYDTQELLRNMYAGNDENYLAMRKDLEESASRIASQRDTLDRQLTELEQNCTLQRVIERERELLRKALAEKAEMRRKEELERAKERAEQTERELMARYQESRQKATQRKAAAQALLKPEIVSESPKGESSELPPPQKQATPEQDTTMQKQVKHMLLKEWWVSNGDDILEILSWVFTGLWYCYIARIVFTSDSNIVGKIFFLIWSLVLAFIILVHKSSRNKE